MRKEVADKLLAKVVDDYDAIAGSFSETRTAVWPEMEQIKTLVKSGDRVLDAGCGNGRAYQLFKGMAIEYEGMDVSAKLIAHARASVNDLLATFRTGSLLALPYESASFDAVIMIASFHHVPSEAYRLVALREAHRVLKPGGVLFMTNWDRWKPRYFPEHLGSVAKKLFGGSPYDFGDVFVKWGRGEEKRRRYYHVFTRRGLASLCTRAGFTVAENYHVAKGVKVPWWKGDNIVTVCRKKAAEKVERELF